MPQTENPSRDRILQRIRAGLRTTVLKPASTAPSAAIFPPVQNPLERFQQECAANLMECILSPDSAGTASALVKVLGSLPEGEIFIQDDPWLRQLIACTSAVRPIRWSTQGAPSEASQATVTLAEALIAQTGSILVTAACGGRGASVVAPCHVVLAQAGQVVPDLQTALHRAQDAFARNSFACVISGSSRTADIEKILVQGAHGPRRLVVILQTGI